MSVLLSINIPTFNRSKFLNSLIESLIADADSFFDIFEINVLDNCSSDNTEDVVRFYKMKFKNISFCRNESNIGAIANIQRAHRIGLGEYVWVLGDDDYLKPQALRKILTVLKHKPAAVLLSYERRTPSGDRINNVSISDVDLNFSGAVDRDFVPRVDPLVGFISANIVQRCYIDTVSDEVFEKLDSQGELGHSAIMYTAMVQGEHFSYIAGYPLVQTADNGYLKHEYWLHVCVRYCSEMPNFLKTIYLNDVFIERYFRNRLLKECVRRILSEKYRGNSYSDILRSNEVKLLLGSKIAYLFVLSVIPSKFFVAFYDLVKFKRT